MYIKRCLGPRFIEFLSPLIKTYSSDKPYDWHRSRRCILLLITLNGHNHYVYRCASCLYRYFTHCLTRQNIIYSTLFCTSQSDRMTLETTIQHFTTFMQFVRTWDNFAYIAWLFISLRNGFLLTTPHAC